VIVYLCRAMPPRRLLPESVCALPAFFFQDYTMGMKKDAKITNERPLSLFPLDFKEALAALLKVKPKPKPEMDKAIKNKAKKKPGH
jgi:hypothetical protein